MPTYHINDDWIMKRVSNTSTVFSGWVENILSTVKKSLGDTNPEAVNEIDKADLSQLKKVDQVLENTNQIISSNKFLKGLALPFAEKLGGLSGYIMKEIEGSLKETEVELFHDLNLDVALGKKKSLSSVLYDVAKERGIDNQGLLYLVKSLPDLESFLYSTNVKKYYRDHTEHQLRVAVLGDFLLEQDFGSGILLNHVSELIEVDKGKLKDKIWWITGLLHDIGYPLEKMTTAVNWSLLNQILKSYPYLDLEVVPLEVMISRKHKDIEEYLAILEEGLSKQARTLIREGLGYLHTSIPVPQVESFIHTNDGHQEYKYQSKVGMDHGVVGALNILKSLGEPEYIRNNRNELEGYIKASQAIAIHNFKDRLEDFTFDKQPLTFLLTMVDELQEWGRPIPVQVRDSYFTVEMKKLSLLDEIVLHSDTREFTFQYKNKKTKELMNFDFLRFCKGKETAFSRLQRGDIYPESMILLQDIEIDTDKKNEERKKIAEAIKQKKIEKAHDSKKDRKKKKKRGHHESTGDGIIVAKDNMQDILSAFRKENGTSESTSFIVKDEYKIKI